MRLDNATEVSVIKGTLKQKCIKHRHEILLATMLKATELVQIMQESKK